MQVLRIAQLCICFALFIICIFSRQSSGDDWYWTTNQAFLPQSTDINFTLNAPRSNLYLDFYANFSQSLLIFWNDSTSSLIPSPNSTEATVVKISSVCELWEVLSVVNVSFVDPSTGNVTSTAYPTFSSNTPSYYMYIATFWGDQIPTSCEYFSLGCFVTDANDTVVSRFYTVEHTGQNEYSCYFYSSEWLTAGLPLFFHLVRQIDGANATRYNVTIPGNVTNGYLQGASRFDNYQAPPLCDRTTITVFGTFFPSRYYSCVLRYNESSIPFSMQSAWVRPQPNATSFLAVFNFHKPSNKTLRKLPFEITAILEKINYTDSTSSLITDFRPDELRSYDCSDKPVLSRRQMIAWTIALPTFFFSVSLAAFLYMQRRKRASTEQTAGAEERAERQPLVRNVKNVNA